MYAEWVIRNRIFVIVVISAVSIFLGQQMTKLKLENTPSLWAPENHPFTKTTRLVEEIFGGRNYTIIGIVPKNGDVFQQSILTKVRNIQEGIEQIPEANQQNIVSIASRKAKAITGTSEGMEVHQFMEQIPTTPEEIARLRADIESNPIFSKALISADNKALAVIADFKLIKDNASGAPLYEAIQRVLSKERDGTVDIYVGGMFIDFSVMEYYIMQMPFYFIAALLIIILIQYLSFRSLQGMFLPTITAVLSVVWALGFMGFMGTNMNVMLMNTPILIMAVTAGHAIQILKRYYEEYRRLSEHNEKGLDKQAINNAAIVESMVRVGPIMIIAGVIAIIVFLSLTVSNMKMTRHFGELAALGILAGLIQELTFIPTLRSFLPPPKAHAIQREARTSILDRLLIALSNALVGKKVLVIFLSTISVILFIFAGTVWLKQDASVMQYFSPESELRKSDAALNSLFAGTGSIIYLVEGQGLDSLKEPGVLRAMASFQEFLDQQPYVGKTQSVADFIKRMNQAMHGDDPAYNTIPDDRGLIAQYFLLYSSSGDLQDFDNFVDYDFQKGAIWVFMKTDSTLHAGELYAKAQRFIDDHFPDDVSVRLGGSLPMASATNEVVIHEKMKNILQMGVALFIISSLVLHSFIGGLFVLTPLVAVVMANFGLMGWLGIPLDMGTATSSSLAVAIGADYELYLMFRLKEELSRTQNLLTAMQDSFLSAGKAIILAAMSIVGGYSVLLLSGFRFYPRFALGVMVTMFVSALATLVLLRAMMMIFKPRFVFGEKRDAIFRSAGFSNVANQEERND